MGLSDLEKGSSLLNNFATRFESIDGKLIGKDGKPLKVYSHIHFREPVNEIVEQGLQSPIVNNIMEPCEEVNDQEDQVNIGDGNSDVGSVKACSYALVLNDKTNTPKVTFMYMNVDDVYLDTTAGNAGLGNVKLHWPRLRKLVIFFVNTVYGYFIGKRLAFPIVENYVKTTWAKYGIERVMLKNGFLFFQFSMKEGMEKVLENGPWLIHLMPIILNVWTPNARLKKDKITKPIMLDAYTSNMCVMSWGRNTYARALIEVLFKKALVESLVVVIPYPNGLGHSMETIKVVKPTMTSDDRFVEINQKHRKGKKLSKPKHINGVRSTKPKPNYYYRPISKPASGNGEASTSQTKYNKESYIPVRNGKTVLDLQDLKYVSLKNLFVALRNEDDIFDVNNVQRNKDDTFGSSNHDSDNEEVEEVFVEKAPPRRLPGKLVYYFDRDDIEEVEHENANSKKG
ncbi:zinc knuckle CX2CX4HX4C containing protein [Tanacetum coccineum]|uniref:Zinc knuckle CX2CX4HX4C containing protein n=1 Tax=Tanacetum coccineum TaxID=301880 RepID=A0ABQ5HVA3_9ASTR